MPVKKNPVFYIFILKIVNITINDKFETGKNPKIIEFDCQVPYLFDIFNFHFVKKLIFTVFSALSGIIFYKWQS